jgi:hypothetical protein
MDLAADTNALDARCSTLLRFPLRPQRYSPQTFVTNTNEKTVEVNQMKRIELSDVTSNLLVLSSVMLAFTPFILGDRLVLIAESALREGAVMCNEFSTYLIKLLS